MPLPGLRYSPEPPSPPPPGLFSSYEPVSYGARRLRGILSSVEYRGVGTLAHLWQGGAWSKASGPRVVYFGCWASAVAPTRVKAIASSRVFNLVSSLKDRLPLFIPAVGWPIHLETQGPDVLGELAQGFKPEIVVVA